MFKQLQNVDTAFRFIRVFFLTIILGLFFLFGYISYLYQKTLGLREGKVMVIANGKIFEAVAEERSKYWPIEIRDHVKMFHFYFFTIHPDEKAIEKSLTRSFYLAGNVAKQEYDNLREKGYYNSMVAANISQEIEEDRIEVDINSTPWRFTYYGTIQITRDTKKVTRSLVTTGTLRTTTPSDNNSHGLSIETWQILENKDIKESTR